MNRLTIYISLFCAMLLNAYHAVAQTYAIVGKVGDDYYAASNQIGTSLSLVSVDVVNGKVINHTPDDIGFTLSFTEKSNNAVVVSIKSLNTNNYLSSKAGSTDLKSSSSTFEWNFIDGQFTVTDGTTKRELALRYSVNYKYFKNFASSNIGDSGFYPAYAYTFSDGYVRSDITNSIGTICVPCPVAADDYSGATFYELIGKEMDKTDADKVSGLFVRKVSQLDAGTPYIYIKEDGASKVVLAYTGDEETTAKSVNGLIGVYEQTQLAAGKFVISGDKVVQLKNGNGGVKANRAYIDMDQVPTYNEGVTPEAKALRLDDDGTITAVESVISCPEDNRVVGIYNINGMRLEQMQTGVNIVRYAGGKVKKVYVNK